jgi:hypothetical protein
MIEPEQQAAANRLIVTVNWVEERYWGSMERKTGLRLPDFCRVLCPLAPDRNVSPSVTFPISGRFSWGLRRTKRPLTLHTDRRGRLHRTRLGTGTRLWEDQRSQTSSGPHLVAA